MKEFTYEIHDPEGLHARPAGLLVKMAANYPCSIKITKETKTVDAKRLFSVMGLAVKCGQQVTLTFEGEAEDTAYEDILAFFKENL